MQQEVKLRVTTTGLTYNLDVHISAVRHVLDLNGQCVLPGVGPLCGADEEDGVHVAGTNPHGSVLQRKAIFKPGRNRTRLPLQERRNQKVSEVFQSNLEN